MSYAPKKFKITNIKGETNDVKVFTVGCTMDPRPGAFFEVSIPGIGECPLASASYNPKCLDILTRNAGNVSSAMFQLKKGDPLFIRGPYGKGFPVDALKGRNLILVAGGTGIAPITSMIEYIERNLKDFGKIFIYFGFRDEEHILLKEKIKRFEKEFVVHIGLSREKKSHKYERGFVQDIMDKHKPSTKNTVALLCGPEVMMEGVSKELNKLGVTNKNIYWSLERRMECAFGSCGRCQIQDLYVCKDGPVFRYDIIKPKLDNEAFSDIQK